MMPAVTVIPLFPINNKFGIWLERNNWIETSSWFPIFEFTWVNLFSPYFEGSELHRNYRLVLEWHRFLSLRIHAKSNGLISRTKNRLNILTSVVVVGKMLLLWLSLLSLLLLSLLLLLFWKYLFYFQSKMYTGRGVKQDPFGKILLLKML